MNQIRQLRELKGITQKDLARRANICQGLLCNLEKERLKPWPSVIKRLAKALRVNPKQLTNNDKEATRDTSLAAGPLVTENNEEVNPRGQL